MPESDVNKMKVADLKRELKLRGLITTGNKTELQERLQKALLDGDISLDDAAISGEDLLDDGLLTDEDEDKILDDDENELLQSLPIKNPNSSSLLSSQKKPEPKESETTKSTKKIVLKRQNSLTTTISSNTTTLANNVATPLKENSEPSPSKIIKLNAHIPITIDTVESVKTASTTTDINQKSKVAALSQQERLELRAKKFGANATPTLANKSNKNDTSSITIGLDISSEEQMELLKKRAQRFGVVSPQIAKLDAAEKLIKRQERFGLKSSTASTKTTAAAAGAADATTTTSNTSSIDYEEKARLRLERFKASTATTATN